MSEDLKKFKNLITNRVDLSWRFIKTPDRFLLLLIIKLDPIEFDRVII